EKGDGVRPLFLASALAARRRLSAAERICKSSRARGTRAEVRQGESWRSATRAGPGAGGAGGKGKSPAGSGVLPQRLSNQPSGRTRAPVAGGPAARGWGAGEVGGVPGPAGSRGAAAAHDFGRALFAGGPLGAG